MCVNMMCEKVGQPCVCKLAKFVSKLPKLKRLDVAGNHLKQLPDSIWDLAELEHLDVSGIV
jgi:Leucine-rich repeat (LRR) protein